MNQYMQLQKDRDNGLLTDTQYADALRQVQWSAVVEQSTPKTKAKKPRRKSPSTLSPEERKRRAALRSITKWIFDVEIDRDETPLYTSGHPESIVEKVFLPLATKCIQYVSNNSVVAEEKNRCALIDSIREMVIIRRRNLRRSKKQATKQKPDETGASEVMRLIYAKRDFFLAVIDNKLVKIPPPDALPLQKEKTEMEQTLHSEEEFLSRSSSCSSSYSSHSSSMTEDELPILTGQSPSPVTKEIIEQSMKKQAALIQKIAELKKQMTILQDQVVAVNLHNAGNCSPFQHSLPSHSLTSLIHTDMKQQIDAVHRRPPPVLVNPHNAAGKVTLSR